MELMKNTKYCVASALAKNNMYTLSYYKVGATKMRLNEHYYNWYFMGANTLIGYLLPFSIIFVLNVYIVHMLRKARKRSSQFIQDSPSPPSSTRPEQPTSATVPNAANENETSQNPAETTQNPPENSDRKVKTRINCRRSRFSRARTLTTESEIVSDFSIRSSNVERNIEDQTFEEENEQLNDEDQIQTIAIRRAPSQRGLVRHGNGRIGRKEDRRLTMISFYIMFMYVVTHIWKLIPNCYDAIYGYDEGTDAILPEWPKWLNVIKDVSHIMVVCNSACNFLPYILFK